MCVQLELKRKSERQINVEDVGEVYSSRLFEIAAGGTVSDGKSAQTEENDIFEKGCEEKRAKRRRDDRASEKIG